MSEKVLIIGALLMMLCSSSSGAAFIFMGGEEKPTGPSGPSGPSGPTGTTFINSALPSTTEATIISPGELGWGQTYNVPESQGDSAPWYLQLQTDGNLVWVKRGTGTQWHLASHTTMPGTKAYLQGDGNLCAYGSDLARVRCAMSHDSSAPAGQHRLVLKSNGEMYVDHGTGISGRSYIHQP